MLLHCIAEHLLLRTDNFTVASLRDLGVPVPARIRIVNGLVKTLKLDEEWFKALSYLTDPEYLAMTITQTKYLVFLKKGVAVDNETISNVMYTDSELCLQFFRKPEHKALFIECRDKIKEKCEQLLKYRADSQGNERSKIVEGLWKEEELRTRTFLETTLSKCYSRFSTELEKQWEQVRGYPATVGTNTCYNRYRISPGKECQLVLEEVESLTQHAPDLVRQPSPDNFRHQGPASEDADVSTSTIPPFQLPPSDRQVLEQTRLPSVQDLPPLDKRERSRNPSSEANQQVSSSSSSQNLFPSSAGEQETRTAAEMRAIERRVEEVAAKMKILADMIEPSKTPVQTDAVTPNEDASLATAVSQSGAVDGELEGEGGTDNPANQSEDVDTTMLLSVEAPSDTTTDHPDNSIPEQDPDSSIEPTTFTQTETRSPQRETSPAKKPEGTQNTASCLTTTQNIGILFEALDKNETGASNASIEKVPEVDGEKNNYKQDEEGTTAKRKRQADLNSHGHAKKRKKKKDLITRDSPKRLPLAHDRSKKKQLEPQTGSEHKQKHSALCDSDAKKIASPKNLTASVRGSPGEPPVQARKNTARKSAVTLPPPKIGSKRITRSRSAKVSSGKPDSRFLGRSKCPTPVIKLTNLHKHPSCDKVKSRPQAAKKSIPAPTSSKDHQKVIQIEPDSTSPPEPTSSSKSGNVTYSGCIQTSKADQPGSISSTLERTQDVEIMPRKLRYKGRKTLIYALSSDSEDESFPPSGLSIDNDGDDNGDSSISLLPE